MDASTPFLLSNIIEIPYRGIPRNGLVHINIDTETIEVSSSPRHRILYLLT